MLVFFGVCAAAACAFRVHVANGDIAKESGEPAMSIYSRNGVFFMAGIAAAFLIASLVLFIIRIGRSKKSIDI